MGGSINALPLTRETDLKASLLSSLHRAVSMLSPLLAQYYSREKQSGHMSCLTMNKARLGKNKMDT
jgi:hypothetical protein